MKLSGQSIYHKDVIKKKRGAHIIRELSDLILDNSGSFNSSCDILNRSLGLK